MSFLLSLDVEIIDGQHINKAALATLYLHRLPGRSYLYLDVDVLILGPLTELRAALRRADLVAVAGNAVATIDDGYRHTLQRELTDEGKRSMRERFARVDLESTAINTGVLGIRASALERWEHHYDDVWPLVRHFRMGDQTAINLLRCLDPVGEVQLGAEFNFSGLALARRRNRLKGELTLRVDAHGRPVLRYRGNDVRLLHYTGSVKPWQTTDDDMASVLWRYFDDSHPHVDAEALRRFEST